jgi:hypothetical protein
MCTCVNALSGNTCATVCYVYIFIYMVYSPRPPLVLSNTGGIVFMKYAHIHSRTCSTCLCVYTYMHMYTYTHFSSSVYSLLVVRTAPLGSTGGAIRIQIYTHKFITFCVCVCMYISVCTFYSPLVVRTAPLGRTALGSTAGVRASRSSTCTYTHKCT